MTDQGKGFEKPNYTAVPNALFALMPVMRESELRVVLVLCRQTFGYHKEKDFISLSQFEEDTGMSRQGVLSGLEDAIQRGVIEECAETGARGVKSYRLVIQVDQSTKMTRTSQQSRPVEALTSQRSRHTKEKDSKEIKEKYIAAAKATAPRTTTPHQRMFQGLCDAMGVSVADVEKSGQNGDYGRVASVLIKAEFPLEELAGLRAFTLKMARDNRWTQAPGVNALSKYFPNYRASKSPSKPAVPPPRPAARPAWLDEPATTGGR